MQTMGQDKRVLFPPGARQTVCLVLSISRVVLTRKVVWHNCNPRKKVDIPRPPPTPLNSNRRGGGGGNGTVSPVCLLVGQGGATGVVHCCVLQISCIA